MAGPKILMLTNAELGQANVFLSTAHALVHQQKVEHVQVHIASFPSLLPTLHEALGSSVATTSDKNTNGDGVTFHPLPGRTMFECFEEHPPEFNIHTVSLQKPGFWNTPSSMRFVMTRAMLTWSSREFADIYDSISDIVQRVKPDLVLVDMIFSPALSAAIHLRRRQDMDGGNRFKLGVLSPNSLKDYIHHLEPKGAAFWKWPAVGSGIAMPLSYWDLPLNIYLLIRMIKLVVTNKNPQIMSAEVQKLIGQPDYVVAENIGMVNNGLEGVDKVFIGGRHEVDFPELDLVGPPKEYLDKIVPCGPILRPLEPLEEELDVWLRKQQAVVFINLGSHCRMSESEVVEMARSLKTLLRSQAASTETGDSKNTNGLSILWKLKRDTRRSPGLQIGPGSALFDILGEEIQQDRVRVVEWLTSQPNSILNAGNIICAISHGGANSYYEALCAGVPQVILPSWLDCYDFANRVERLGIGRWGSRKGAPRWTESELTPVLMDVVVEKNTEYTASSRRLADICRENGGGRETAAAKILELIASP